MKKLPKTEWKTAKTEWENAAKLSEKCPKTEWGNARKSEWETTKKWVRNCKYLMPTKKCLSVQIKWTILPVVTVVTGTKEARDVTVKSYCSDHI